MWNSIALLQSISRLKACSALAQIALVYFATEKEKQELRIERLLAGQRDNARSLFALLSNVFGGGEGQITDAYIDQLLEQTSFWALAAIEEGRVIAGLTAHTLPMTKSQSCELLIYDIAVDDGYQRRGIGQMLIKSIRREASLLGIKSIFVLADGKDIHAVKFYQKAEGREQAVVLFEWTELERADSEDASHRLP